LQLALSRFVVSLVGSENLDLDALLAVPSRLLKTSSASTLMKNGSRVVLKVAMNNRLLFRSVRSLMRQATRAAQMAVTEIPCVLAMAVYRTLMKRRALKKHRAAATVPRPHCLSSALDAQIQSTAVALVRRIFRRAQVHRMLVQSMLSPSDGVTALGMLQRALVLMMATADRAR